ncbi:MAG: hypothetical protein IPM63_17825 [Acidobacteriota bacterium]|nr:MAG: hypothetical protein IPM63_17825 [Acidobacteriota bacterium]
MDGGLSVSSPTVSEGVDQVREESTEDGGTMTASRKKFALAILIAVHCLGPVTIAQIGDPSEPPVDDSKSAKSTIRPRPVAKTLEDYLRGREIKPTSIFNNEDETRESLRLEKISIAWKTDREKYKLDLVVDGKPIEFQGKKSKGSVFSDSEPIPVEHFNSLDEIAIFELRETSLLAFRFGFQVCSGMSCSVTGYLVLDLKTGAENWFASLGMFDRIRLFDIKNDGTPDFLVTTYRGAWNSCDYRIGYTAYTRTPDGSFELAIDPKEKAFEIIRRFKCPDGGNVEEYEEGFEVNWMEEVRKPRKLAEQ